MKVGVVSQWFTSVGRTVQFHDEMNDHKMHHGEYGKGNESQIQEHKRLNLQNTKEQSINHRGISQLEELLTVAYLKLFRNEIEYPINYFCVHC